MDLGLLQREVAEIIGVTESSVWNWEHGTDPELHYNPRIIKFLGYIPFDCPDDTVGRLSWYKKAHGFTLIELGKQMNLHPDQTLYRYVAPDGSLREEGKKLLRGSQR